jgi:hypothetical protein
MNHPMLFQLMMARDWCIEVAESCPKELSEIKMDVFNNTIHWHVGHILNVAERMMFNRSDKSTYHSSAFIKWFESGTRPTDWIEHPPKLEELIVLLKEQQARIRSITPDNFNDRLDKPFYGFKTYGECAGFVAIHETLHVGKMEEMLRVIRQKFG